MKKAIPFIICIVLFLAGNVSFAQLMNHYWSLNFNSQSSLLSGAVVAGDGGNASIYYNPATISEIKTGSNLSFAASLFTWGAYHFANALGDDISMTNISFHVQPQFLSYSYRPKNSKFAFAITAVTRMKEKFDISYYNSREIDIIKNNPGLENYSVGFKYFLDYQDNWFGLAGSYDINKNFKIGGSIFISAAYLSYRYHTSALAYSTTDTLWIDGVPNPSLVSEGSYNEDLKFTNLRLITKVGIVYSNDKWRFGLNFTSGSLSLLTTGKESNRLQRVANITNPNNQEFMPGWVIVDGLTRNELNAQIKYPFSLAFGFIKEMNGDDNRLYFTIEYFNGIKPYKLIDAPINSNITNAIVYDQLDNKDWLSVADVAKPVLNVAVGYRWEINQNLMFLNGFRTDFNNINNADYGKYNNLNKINTADINIYHYTGGFQFYFLQKYLLVAGGELSFGYDTNKKQIANFANPVEYVPEDNRVLMGPLEDKMDVFYFGFNVYLSAVFKFDRKADKPKN